MYSEAGWDVLPILYPPPIMGYIVSFVPIPYPIPYLVPYPTSDLTLDLILDLTPTHIRPFPLLSFTISGECYE